MFFDKMSQRSRISIDLRSQDLTVADMENFRKTALKDISDEEDSYQELIMFSAKSKPYQYSSLEEFSKDTDAIPDDAGYFYYTISISSGDRFSLYLDLDRPAKMVMEGSKEFIEANRKRMEKAFPKGGERYKAQGNIGIFMIWGIVVTLAIAVIIAYSILSEPNPYLTVFVLFISSILGIYLSLSQKNVLNPANTMSLGQKRKNPKIDLILHIITIALGIISVVLVMLFFEYNM